jgi:EAL domain-containing protein (putative c-di-GMP-specific phosphodiesterase class I)
MPVGTVPVDWPSLLIAACAGEGLRAVYQPIVDLARGVTVGYEALARFDASITAGPDRWFAAARTHGCPAELEAGALRAALAARADLPVNCFLTLNVSPDLLGEEPIRSVWAEQGDLRGLVIELTEQAPIESYAALEDDLARLRAAGALIAVDDAGAGYAGLRHLLALRPSIIKLDRALVEDVDRDSAKLALIEMIGTFAGRVDAWLLAEGVERADELDVLASLGVPLAQGYHLARPAAPWAQLASDTALRLRSRNRAGAARTVRDVLVSATGGDGLPPVATDGEGRPSDDGLCVHLDTPIADALLRAITRVPERRYDPLRCTDGAGRLLGLAPVDRLIRAALG